MQKVTFISALPYLTLPIKGSMEAVQFIKHYYSTEDPTKIQILRVYAGSNPTAIAEGEEKDLEGLIKQYNEAEDKMIREAEKREQAKADAEERKKALHNLSTTLRMADKAYR